MHELSVLSKYYESQGTVHRIAVKRKENNYGVLYGGLKRHNYFLLVFTTHFIWFTGDIWALIGTTLGPIATTCVVSQCMLCCVTIHNIEIRLLRI